MVAMVVRKGIFSLAVLLLFFPVETLADSSNLGAYIRPVGGIKPGDQIPEFHAKGIYGEDVDLARLVENKKKVVFAFWSMYCQACIEKFNAMIIIQKKYQDSGVMVVSVNTDGEYRKGEQTIRDFIVEYEKKYSVKTNFPVLYDETNWLAMAMSIDFLPTIITMDQNGRVHKIYRRFGEENEAEIIKGIDEIIQALLSDSQSTGVEDKP